MKVSIANMRTKDDNGQDINITNDQGKAEVLSKYFAGVFTQEKDVNQTPLPTKEATNKMSRMEITEEDILIKLEKLKVDKSKGPDQLYPVHEYYGK